MSRDWGLHAGSNTEHGFVAFWFGEEACIFCFTWDSHNQLSRSSARWEFCQLLSLSMPITHSRTREIHWCFRSPGISVHLEPLNPKRTDHFLSFNGWIKNLGPLEETGSNINSINFWKCCRVLLQIDPAFPSVERFWVCKLV